MEKRSEINQILEQAFGIGTLDPTKNLYRVLDILTELKQFCPPEIWEPERSVLAASILDQIPATKDAGSSFQHFNFGATPKGLTRQPLKLFRLSTICPNKNKFLKDKTENVETF